MRCYRCHQWPCVCVDGITIIHGDCREALAWLDADALLTDPPYGMFYESGWLGRPIQNDRDTSARDEALSLWGEKPGLVFGRWDCPHPDAARHCLIWDKGDWPGMGDLALPWGPSTEEIYVIGRGFLGSGRKGSIISGHRLTSTTLHPNEKPLGLISRLIESLPGDVIADPFMGSGTTLRAAKNLGRRAIGIEIEEGYCAKAAQRLQQEVFAL